MPEPATSTIAGNYVDAKFSPDGSQFYAVSGNTVSVIDVATGKIVNHYTVGTQLGALDLSADGHYLAVVETSSATADILYRIDLTSGTATTYSETSDVYNHFYDISFLADGTALVSQQSIGNASAPLQQLDFSTGTFTNVPSTIQGAATLTASSDHSHVLIEPYGYALASYVYVSGTGIVAQATSGPSDPYAGASIPPIGSGVQATSPDGSLYVQGQTLDVYDSALNLNSALKDGYPYLAQPSGLSFSPDNHELYIADGNAVVVIDTGSWTAIGAYSLPGNAASPGANQISTIGYGDIIEVSPDGHTLSIIQANGSIQLIDLNQTQFASTNGNDTLAGSGVLYGLGGNDDLTGTASGTWMYGGPGDDTYHVTSSNDWVFEAPNQGHDTVYSTVDYTLPANVEDLYLQGNAINGSGNDLDNLIVGNDQNNVLSGGAGNDHLEGGAGNDTLDGGPGDDILDGGSGVNTASYQSATSGVTVNLNISGPQNTVGAGNDTLVNIQNLTGSNYDDHLVGDANANVLNGGEGADILTGGLGADTLNGGGDGNDTFQDTAAGLNGDTIVDFGGNDKIVITDANLATFTFSLNGNVLTYSGGSLTLTQAVPGKIVALAAPGGGVQLSLSLDTLATNDQLADQLTKGYWGGDYHHWNVTQGGTLTVDIHTLAAAEQTLALAALQEWTDIIGVNFQQVTSGAQIVFSDAEDTTANGPIAQTDASWSNHIITSANIQISKSWVNTYGSTLDSYSFQTYVHEIGHALGLGHPGNYNDSGTTYTNDTLFKNDSWATSIMSYFSQHDNTYFSIQGFSELNAVTPMPADILAMQQLYGLSTTTRAGDTTYGDHSNAGGIYNAVNYADVAYTIYDSGGNDTIDYSLSSANQLINLNPETFSNVNGYTGNLEIARGVVIENAIGGSGNDTLIGNSANNVLTGNAGADTLTGGGGEDVFLDTAAGHNGDTITDFHPGDRIVFSDATPGSFTFSLSGNTLTYSGGSMTLHGVVGDRFTASTAAAGGVQLTEAHSVANDFNGDAGSDILWRNDSGYLTEWLSTSNGSFVSNASAGTGAVDNSWQIAGIGDFNGDGHNDILWRNPTTGYVTEWLGTSNGSFTSNTAANSDAADTSWQVAGTGDFNGDGISDILWRNTATGYTTEWLGTSSGSFLTNSGAGTGAADNSWQVAGTGDFNGDGISDILWRNTATGYTTEWLGTTSGSFVPNSGAGNGAADPSWQIVGIGDFNSDGHSDILWRSSATGYVTEWLGTSTGAFVSNQANAGTGAADTSWHVQDSLFG